MSIGDRLTSPSSGYKRIDGNDESIKTYGTGFYSGTDKSYGYYNNSYIATTKANDYFEFAAYTTKLRIFVKMDNTCTELPETHDIYIDGTLIASVSSYLNIAPGSTSGQRFIFEKTNMSKSLHTIRIVNKTDGYLVLDCIEIDYYDAALTSLPQYKLKHLELNLTSDDSNGCLVTFSPPLSGSETGFNAFNGIDKGEVCYHSAHMTGKGFITLRLPTKKKLKSVIYKTRDSSWWYPFPNFYIYGSNDGTDYTLIKSIDSSRWARSSSYPINFYYNQYSYRWYKFEADINNSWYTCREIELFIRGEQPYFIKTDSKLIGGNNTEFDLNSNLSNLLTNDDNIFDLSDLTPLTNSKYKVMKIVSV